jgi:CHAT domain-containing protein
MPKRGGAGLMAQVSAAENSMLSVGLVLKNGGQLLESDTNTNLNRAPGILTAYEVQNMNLNQTELVVLSACETGLGHQHNGEGVFGLQRAFQVAGAKNVIFSLFKVDDAVTATLMRQFTNTG